MLLNSSEVSPLYDLPAADYAAILTQLGVPAGFAQGLASWDTDTGALVDDSHQLSRLLGRPITSLTTAVVAALA